MPKLSSLDQPAGHMLCGFALIGIGIFCWWLKAPYDQMLVYGGAMMLGIAQRGLNGKTVIPTSSGSDTKTTISTTATSVTDPPKTP
jgi:hypothetical protein